MKEVRRKNCHKKSKDCRKIC